MKTIADLDETRILGQQGNAEAQPALVPVYPGGAAGVQGYAPALTSRLHNARNQSLLVRQAEAANWYRTRADQGSPDSQRDLAIMYERGFCVAQDYAESARWHRKSADQGSRESQHDLGVMYEKGLGVAQDYAESAKWHRKGADQGSAESQHDLGVMYEKGVGVAQDYAESARWHRKSADQGSRESQHDLGVKYETGLGVARDYAKAVTWYRKSADQGLAESQHDLGVMYESGFGVEQDAVCAYAWYDRAAARGVEAAHKSRDRIAVTMTTAQIAEADLLNREWERDLVTNRAGSWEMSPREPRPLDSVEAQPVSSSKGYGEVRKKAARIGGR
jgi:TPR repeat protein